MFAYRERSASAEALDYVTHRDDTARLHEHVVQRRRDSTRADAVRVRRRPSDLHWVYVRVPGNQRDHRKVCPLRSLLVEGVESDEEGQRPDLQHDRRDNATVDDLAHEAEYQKCDEAEHR